MKGTTKRQQEVLDFIGSYTQNHAYPPTVREMAENFGISIKGAHDHILALKKKGLLRQDDKKSRTMELVGAEQDTGFRDIPLLGTVAAGRPVLSEENREGVIRFPVNMLKRNCKYFALRVRGDSMEGAGIMDGDTALIESRNTVKNGDIAVVHLEDEGVTLKTFYLESSRVRLQPENPKYPPIYSTCDLRVIGRLAHIIRSYESPA